jgi:hypothetical protein
LFAIETAAVCFIAMQKSVKKSLLHGFSIKLAKTGNFKGAYTLPLKIFFFGSRVLFQK